MWPMQTQQLNNGSFLSGCAIEIVSIPDASISPYADELETRMAYSADIGRSLSSIFDVYKSFYAQTGNRLAIELIWFRSRSVSNICCKDKIDPSVPRHYEQ